MDETTTQFISTNKLDFMVAPYFPIIDDGKRWQRFKIGTCKGLWRATQTHCEILAIVNSEPGNGHFSDVLEWFEYSCKRHKYSLMILEIMNDRFKNHLIEKRGFVKIPGENDAVEKRF